MALQHDKAALLTGVQAPSTGTRHPGKATRSSFNGDYDRIRPSLDIESNLKSGIAREGRPLPSQAVKREYERHVYEDRPLGWRADRWY
jgi:hypothetical protein